MREPYVNPGFTTPEEAYCPVNEAPKNFPFARVLTHMKTPYREVITPVPNLIPDMTPEQANKKGCDEFAAVFDHPGIK